MGGLLSLALSAEAIGLVQGWHYGERAEKFTRYSNDLDFQGLRLEVLGTIREEIRDQVFVIMSSLDTLMVVATLMLSLGFGFVVEGTFPPKSAEALGDWEIVSIGFSVDPLVVYAILCAMSLVCPFWCLIFTIRMRYEVDGIVREHMQELKKQLSNVIQNQPMQAPDETEQQPEVAPARDLSTPLLEDHLAGLNIRSFACPGRFRKVLAACPARRQESLEDAANAVVSTVARHVGPFSIQGELRSLDQAQIVKWAEKDLLQRMTTYRFYIKMAHLLLWMGMLCAIFTCSILLGLYMMETFPHTPLVWMSYSTIVGLNGGLAVVFAIWMWCLSSANPAAAATTGRRDTSRRDLSRTRSSTASCVDHTTSSPSLWNRSSTMDVRRTLSFRDSSKQPPPEKQATLRIRDGGSGLNAFREVSFPSRQTDPRSKAQPVLDYNVLVQRICAKFQSRHSCKQVTGIKDLVRLRDRLAIVDDEDASKLYDGDELEAFFSLSVG